MSIYKLLELSPILGRKLTRIIFFPVFYIYFFFYKKNNRAALFKISQMLVMNYKQSLNVYYQGYRHLVSYLIDFMWLANASDEKIKKAVADITVENLHYLDSIQELNRPIILFSIHMGSFHLGFIKLASYLKGKRNLYIIKASPKSDREGRVIDRFSKLVGRVKPLRIGEGSALEAFKVLRNCEVVTMMLDREAKVTERSNVNFFNMECYMQNGPSKLAVATNAVILPVVNFKNSAGKVIVRIEAPVDVDNFKDVSNSERVNLVTQEIASIIESWIRIDPHQYFYWDELIFTMYRNKQDKVKQIL